MQPTTLQSTELKACQIMKSKTPQIENQTPQIENQNSADCQKGKLSKTQQSMKLTILLNDSK